MYDERIRQFRDKAERNRIEGKPGLALDYTHAADAIEELWREVQKYHRQHPVIPAANVVERPRWISVTERLPEEWKSVLTYQPYKNDREKPLIRVSWYIGAGIWRECEQANTLELPVTHWMPLPEPPKEEV